MVYFCYLSFIFLSCLVVKVVLICRLSVKNEFSMEILDVSCNIVNCKENINIIMFYIGDVGSIFFSYNY